ncbi:MAG: ABC transporter ATP-binding protein, partial [Gammaproteobacteria bacterium]|nr:ABC transporter ATP-binding protein [Gammaproteobacteria bacterium]
MKPAVDIHALNFSYGSVPTLSGIDLQVAEGEFLGIVGPNAGGKSTLLKLILGLLKPQSGRINVLGHAPCAASRLLGYVPQYPTFVRDFPISVEQVVQLGRLGLDRNGGQRHGKWHDLWPGRVSGADRAAIRRSLAEVEAGDIAKRQIGSLSGGQLQRVLLARALGGEPRILILDEPTANIDQRMESEIFDLLKALNARMTILVVSHDVAYISRYVSRVACINRTLVC